MIPTQKNCINCGAPMRGRIDKKFCDDSCRNTYNNQQNSASTNLIRNINHALKKNRNILESLIPEGEELAKTSKDKLLRMDFQFKYFTHTYETKKGHHYHYCYDYGYLKLEGDWFLVVKGKEV
jgi:predicted nucleic acid-binding Zn ribbon protein